MNDFNTGNRKQYVLLEKSLYDLEKLVEEHQGEYNFDVYEYKVKRDEEFSEEQKVIQAGKKWNANITNDIRVYDNRLYDLVKEVGYKEILNGEKENIIFKIQDKVMNSNVRGIIYVEDNFNKDLNKTIKRAWVEIEYGDREEGTEYLEDEEEMNKDLQQVRHDSWNYTKRDANGNPAKEWVMLEDVKLNVYTYNYRGTFENVGKLVKKFIRNELTYCIKQGNVVIPQEYLDKGKEGIEEWRETKASKNKNNNMEKRMLRQMLRDKKHSILMQMRTLMWRFPNGQDTRDWSIPHLTIYGNGNKTMAQKLVNQVLGKMTDQEILNMTDEEISKKFKEYWKGILNKTIEQIDDVITYGDE